MLKGSAVAAADGRTNVGDESGGPDVGVVPQRGDSIPCQNAQSPGPSLDANKKRRRSNWPMLSRIVACP